MYKENQREGISKKVLCHKLPWATDPLLRYSSEHEPIKPIRLPHVQAKRLKDFGLHGRCGGAKTRTVLERFLFRLFGAMIHC